MAATLIVAEPPAVYMRRPPLVIDASVLASALFSEAEQEQALTWMRGRALFAPQLVDLELTNAALNKVRRKSTTMEAASEALSSFAALDIERCAVLADGVFRLASRWQLTAYDAAYLWLAAELKAPLATFDEQLGKAAQSYLGGLGNS